MKEFDHLKSFGTLQFFSCAYCTSVSFVRTRHSHFLFFFIVVVAIARYFGEQVKKCKDVEPAALEEQKQREKDKAAGVVPRAPSYPNKRPRPSASVALAERAKYAPLGADFPLEKMVRACVRVCVSVVFHPFLLAREGHTDLRLCCAGGALSAFVLALLFLISFPVVRGSLALSSAYTLLLFDPLLHSSLQVFFPCSACSFRPAELPIFRASRGLRRVFFCVCSF